MLLDLASQTQSRWPGSVAGLRIERLRREPRRHWVKGGISAIAQTSLDLVKRTGSGLSNN